MELYILWHIPGGKTTLDNFILSFDVNDEIFREIRLPENDLDDGLIPIGNRQDFRLAVSKGSLALIAFVKPGQTFLGCTDSGQLLFFQMSGRIVSYDPESRNMSNIEIPSPYWLGYTTDLMESLVLLDHK
ncbi:hypothetical protein CMV_019599 [Castanea mollissima]|uniref:F-box protein n=1 Tax=Castanea mollissima TaxID=60419 RepID=A0A8J4VGJ1_9ROSI|nr:hypothetical protein CMV_019599 [Castanea mollissima]